MVEIIQNFKKYVIKTHLENEGSIEWGKILEKSIHINTEFPSDKRNENDLIK